MKAITKAAGLTAVACALIAGSAGMAGAAGSSANAKATGSPGVISGNNVQVPVSVPINLCGNTGNVIALLNPATDSTCANRG